MNKKLLTLFAVILLLGMFTSAYAEDNNHANAYMRMGIGAKAMAMGGTGVSFMDNITATYWNPAALGNVKRIELASTYTDMNLDRMYNQVAFGVPFSTGYVALSWINAGTKDIEGYDGEGNITDDYNADDNNINLSVGLGRNSFKVGFSAKMYMSDIDGDSVTGYGADLGLLWEINQYMSVGAMFRDIYADMDGEEIPTQYIPEISVHPIHGLTFAANMKMEKHSDLTKVSIGGEYWTGLGRDTEVGSNISGINMGEKTTWAEIFSGTQAGLRLGMNDGNFTAGGGFRFSMVEFNYAFITADDESINDDLHQLSLVLRF